MPNLILSFVVGVMVMIFGMYGGVSGGLPEGNPHRRKCDADRYEAARRRTAWREPG